MKIRSLSTVWVVACLLAGSHYAVGQKTRLLTDIDTTGLLKSKALEVSPATVAFQCFPTTTTLAEYKGGTDALRSFMRKQLQYPPALLRAQVEGWTEIQFLVDSQGHISQLVVSHSLCQPWDEEVLRVVRLLNGQFEPATYNGRPVASLYRLRVPFSIK